MKAKQMIDRRYGWPRLMWIPVAAEYINARPFFVEETLIRGKQVRVVQVGNRQCIPIEELDAWVTRKIV